MTGTIATTLHLDAITTTIAQTSPIRIDHPIKVARAVNLSSHVVLSHELQVIVLEIHGDSGQ